MGPADLGSDPWPDLPAQPRTRHCGRAWEITVCLTPFVFLRPDLNLLTDFLACPSACLITTPSLRLQTLGPSWLLSQDLPHLSWTLQKPPTMPAGFSASVPWFFWSSHPLQ